MLKAVLVAQMPLSLLTCSFMNEDNPDFSIKLSPSSQLATEIQHLENHARRQINGMSKGLLEIHKTKGPVDESGLCRAEFLHRTVHGFLNENDVSSFLNDMIPKGNNVYFDIGRGLLGTFKFTPRKSEVLIQALDYASKSEEECGASDTAMLDELNKTNKIKSLPWANAECKFLESAIPSRLVDYVQSTLLRLPHLVSS